VLHFERTMLQIKRETIQYTKKSRNLQEKIFPGGVRMRGQHYFIIVFLILLLGSGGVMQLVWSQPNIAAEAPRFSLPGGFYSDPLEISLSITSADARIYYTLDCSEPTTSSLLYAGPIKINQTTVIRARVFEAGFLPGPIVSHTYLLNQKFHIATLSIITDPGNLWGDTGIYTNYDQRGDRWERPATIEFIEPNGRSGFYADVGIRIHGGTSRVFKKKSFRYYFRSEYGQSRLSYPLFAPKPIYEFKRFVTSASFQDAPDNSTYNSGTLLRDAVLHEIGRRIEPDISLGTRPVALFLAGKPWGIYNAIERIDRHLVKINFGLDSCDVIENYSHAKEGSMDRWNEMIDFFESSDLRLPENYEKAKSYIDIQNFTRYNIVEIYSANTDWPNNNNFAYRGYQKGSKWKWLLWDLDHAFGYIGANTLEQATEETTRGTLILRKLLENKDYRNYFLNESADLFNTVLQPRSMKGIIDSLAAIIRDDLYFEIDRWGGSFVEWQNSVQFLKNFADHRLGRLWQYLLWELDVPDKHLLTLKAPQGGPGKVRINDICIGDYPWSGYYFKDVPIEIEAVPAPGFKIMAWSDSSLHARNKFLLTMNADYTIYPIFEQDPDTACIVINEINYHSAPDFDPEDWIELYNASGESVDVSDWHLKDDNASHDFKFPAGTSIEPYGFLVVCRNRTAFQDLFPEVTNFIGDMGFGLGGNGDDVKIYNASFRLIDSVTYDDKAPWPLEPDGNGPTLELLDPQLDNSLAENWRASSGHGSPGKPNFYLPGVTKFVVTDSSGSARFTNSRDVLIQMAEQDADGNVVKWLINENPLPPVPDDFMLTARPAHYHITGAEGSVTIYAWVLDNEDRINQLTPASQASIQLDLTAPGFKFANLDSNRLEINFSEPVVGAQCSGNYEIIPSLDSIAVTHAGGNRYQLSTIKPQNARIIYQLIISNVEDSAGNGLVKNQFSFGGYGGLLQPLQLKLIKSSISHYEQQGWNNAIDGDIQGWDGAVKVAGNPCFAIFGFDDRQMHTIQKIRLKTDAGIGNVKHWVKEFAVAFSSTNIKSQDFVTILQAKKSGGDWEEFSLDTVAARFVKFSVIQPADDWCQLAELEIWGQDSRAGLAIEKNSLGADSTNKVAETNLPEKNDDTHQPGLSNFPNPFNESTLVRFRLTNASHVRLTVYNILGERIITLLDEWKAPGSYQVCWNGNDQTGLVVPSGIYILRITAAGLHQTQKLILMR